MRYGFDNYCRIDCGYNGHRCEYRFKFGDFFAANGIEYRLKQIEDSLNEIKTIPERVTILETKMSAVEDALKEMRIS